MDCEFVKSSHGVNLLARVSIVNYKGEIVLDTLVNPQEPVSDYVTHITGLSKELLEDAPSYFEVNLQVIKLISNSVIIGHTLLCDLEKFTSQEGVKVRYIDVSEYKDYMTENL